MANSLRVRLTVVRGSYKSPGSRSGDEVFSAFAAGELRPTFAVTDASAIADSNRSHRPSSVALLRMRSRDPKAQQIPNLQDSRSEDSKDRLVAGPRRLRGEKNLTTELGAKK